jgi:uncharacterized membrane protein YhaH (DUF805 family)
MYRVLHSFRHCTDFTSRSLRREYLQLMAFVLFGALMATMVDFLIGYGPADELTEHEVYGFWAIWYFSGRGPVLAFFLFAMVLPVIAATFRRLHDIDFRGWWILVGLVPFIGWFTLLFLMLFGGTHGPNRFGPDPLEHTHAT